MAAVLASTLFGCRGHLSDSELYGVWMSPADHRPGVAVTFIVGGRCEVAEPPSSAAVPGTWRRDGPDLVVTTPIKTRRLSFDGQELGGDGWTLRRL